MVTTQRSRRAGGEDRLDRLALAFDDERVVANAGLVLVSTLAERLGIEQIVDETLDLGERAGAARPGRARAASGRSLFGVVAVSPRLRRDGRGRGRF